MFFKQLKITSRQIVGGEGPRSEENDAERQRKVG